MKTITSLILISLTLSVALYHCNTTLLWPDSRSLQVDSCSSIQPLSPFDIDEYASQPWFSVLQRETLPYQPLDLECVEARYTKSPQKWWHQSIMGWDISVNNYGISDDGPNGIFLCADILNPAEPSALNVGFCFIPSIFYRWLPGGNVGSYWVVAYNETVGRAIISGGPPTIEVTEGYCQTESNLGLWFFFREREPSEEDIRASLDDAEALGFEVEGLTDLYNITQSGCADRD